jgi:hypothetical protein
VNPTIPSVSRTMLAPRTLDTRPSFDEDCRIYNAAAIRRTSRTRLELAGQYIKNLDGDLTTYPTRRPIRCRAQGRANHREQRQLPHRRPWRRRSFILRASAAGCRRCWLFLRRVTATVDDATHSRAARLMYRVRRGQQRCCTRGDLVSRRRRENAIASDRLHRDG